jgi:hypothetical protein
MHVMVSSNSEKNGNQSSVDDGGGHGGGDRNGEKDKLRDGPCRIEYKSLEVCASKKQRPDEAPMTEKERMQACPSQTDRLIKCIHRHPLFFQSPSS